MSDQKYIDMGCCATQCDAHSADASVYKIMLEYLQSYELAVVNNQHTNETFCNAAAQGNLEYLTRYVKYYTDYTAATIAAVENKQFDSLRFLVGLDTNRLSPALYVDRLVPALHVAIKLHYLDIIELLLGFDMTDLLEAICIAAELKYYDIIRLFVKWRIFDLADTIACSTFDERVNFDELCREIGIPETIYLNIHELRRIVPTL